MSFDSEISEWKQKQNLEEENRRMQERVKASFETGFQEGFKVGYEKRKSEPTEERMTNADWKELKNIKQIMSDFLDSKPPHLDDDKIIGRYSDGFYAGIESAKLFLLRSLNKLNSYDKEKET